jgi:hypothetical protein
MFESTNERTARVIYALTTGKGIENLDRIDMVIAYLLLLVMLMALLIVTPVFIYDELYKRYWGNEAREQQEMRE